MVIRINPARQALWRDETTLQIGLGRESVVLPNLDEQHERLIRLREDQNRSMERLRQSLVQQALHTVEAFPALFNRDRLNMDAQQLSLATGEATACLNYLIAQGFASRAIDKNGVFFYSCIK